MKFRKTKTAALALASLLAVGSFSGCALVTNNLKKDLEQVVATVDLTASEDYASLKGTIAASDVLKRDLVASYASVGSTYVNSYGMDPADVYEMLKNQLVNRQLYVPRYGQNKEQSRLGQRHQRRARRTKRDRGDQIFPRRGRVEDG